MKTRSQSGITLIEVLIAVSLVALLSVGILLAMRLGFVTMDKVDERLVSNRRVVNSRGIIESEINGFVYTMADYSPQPGTTYQVPFLQTEPQMMRFVTTHSLEDGWRGRPQIAILQVIPGTPTEGDSRPGLRLILNEMPYTGGAQAGQNIVGIEQDTTIGHPIVHYTTIPAGPKSFVVADRLAFCRFWYLQPLVEPPFQIWRPDWAMPQQLPQGIRIEMAPLDTSKPGLHVTTVTVPLNVTKEALTRYAD